MIFTIIIIDLYYDSLIIFFKGFSGHLPFGYSSFGKANQALTNGALCDFTSNYRKRLSTEWAPVSVSRPDPPLAIISHHVYQRHVGLLPNYGGHVPGEKFRYDLEKFLYL